MSVCKKCGLEKKESEFYRTPKGTLYGICKSCCYIRERLWKEAHKEIWRDYQRDWSKGQRQRCRGAVNKAGKLWRGKNPGARRCAQ